MTKTKWTIFRVKSPDYQSFALLAIWALPPMLLLLPSTKTSSARERGQRGVFSTLETTNRVGLLSPRKYTDIALVINLLSFHCVAPTTNGLLFSLSLLTSYWVFFFSAQIARALWKAWAPWQFYLPGRLVNIVNSWAGLCYADQTGLPRGQTSASHSGPS